jgi:primosomal protein N' (replication factor Y) (superfamily II helicase)
VLYFLDLIIPVSINQTFTYSCNPEVFHDVELGSRVIVQFGRSKYYTGIVVNKHHNKPELYKVKEIEHVLDDLPVVNTLQLKFWKWITEYYMSTIGDVYKNAMPSALLLQSETVLCLSDHSIDNIANIDFEKNLTDDEFLVIEALKNQKKLSLKDVGDILSKKNPMAFLKSMVDKDLIVPFEEIKNRYKPAKIRQFKIDDNFADSDKLNEVLDNLSKAPKQYEVLMRYLSKHPNVFNLEPIAKFINEFDISRSALNALVEKQILEVHETEVSRLKSYDEQTNPIKELSEDQEIAFNQIKEAFTKKDVTLFHGITSSGKTEVYIKLINEHLLQGKQILFLVPEIALTSQLIKRLQNIFGDKAGFYHSKYNLNERVEVWNNVKNNLGTHQIVIGPRSALFLPFENLGLVIVDEEHEATFKQNETTPRYHARDAAIVLAKLHNAKVLLGSATPSLESYYNYKQGKYALVELNKRYGGLLPPEIQIADISKDHRKKMMKKHFGELLYTGIEETLEEKKQIILFQNRRGYAPVVECQTCGSTVECPNCDVTLTYHSKIDQLRCHYCSYTIPMIKNCKNCGSPQLDTKGLGTQQIEIEVNELFDKASTSRLDHDAAKKKNAYQEIIEEFENGDIDILIGTQMISKGLDFDDVSLVGVLNADSILKYPDFRAEERAYQLLSQVSGRSGRKGKRGKVIIQSFDPFHKILQQVSTSSYIEMAEEQLYERRNFYYPPYYRLIEITLQHRDRLKIDNAASNLAESLKVIPNTIVLGPEYPPIARINNKYNKKILLKLNNDNSLVENKKKLKQIINAFSEVAAYKSIRLILNVDPS